jgi:hypothetical protein
VTGYQIYLLTPEGGVLRAFELNCANDQDAVREAILLRGTGKFEIEIWEHTRLVRWLPMSRQLQTGVIWEKIARVVTLIALSSGLATLGGTFIKWSVETLSLS